MAISVSVPSTSNVLSLSESIALAFPSPGGWIKGKNIENFRLFTFVKCYNGSFLSNFLLLPAKLHMDYSWIMRFAWFVLVIWKIYPGINRYFQKMFHQSHRMCPKDVDWCCYSVLQIVTLLSQTMYYRCSFGLSCFSCELTVKLSEYLEYLNGKKRKKRRGKNWN